MALRGEGIHRYGFHGLSYAHLMEEIQHRGNSAAISGCVILAHLGSGASMAAVRDGESIDTSMSFTPASGMPSTTPAIWTRDWSAFWPAPSTRARLKFRKWRTMSPACSACHRSVPTCVTYAQESADARAGEAMALFCYQAPAVTPNSSTRGQGKLPTVAAGSSDNYASARCLASRAVASLRRQLFPSNLSK